MKRVCLLLVALFGACEKDNPEYCLGAAHQSDPYCAGDAMPAGCTSNDECSGATSVCELTSGTCVQCVSPDQVSSCSGTTPVCGADDACRACSAHAECSSEACLPDGSCAAETDVAYVSATGSGTQCTRSAPCGTLAAGLTTGRAIVKIAAGTVKSSTLTTIDGKKVTIVAEAGAKLTRDTIGPLLQVQSANADVEIVGLEISGQTGMNDFAVQLSPNGGSPKLSLVECAVTGNQGVGLSTSGGTLTVSQSTISSNQGVGISTSGGTFTLSRSTVSQNHGGGVSVGAMTTVDITNNFIFRNGDADAGTFGGVNLGIGAAGSNRFAHNTIVDNRASSNSAGVTCNVGAFVAPNNIIARNELAGSTATANAQTYGMCTYGASNVQADVTGLGFVEPEPPAPFNYHLTAGSSAVDQASASTVLVDFDGDPRPSGTASDIGADELVP